MKVSDKMKPGNRQYTKHLPCSADMIDGATISRLAPDQRRIHHGPSFKTRSAALHTSHNIEHNMSGLDLNTYDSTSVRGFYAWTETLKGVHYGPGVLETALPKLLDVLGAKRALIVTGKSLREKVRAQSLLSTRPVRPS
jgi:hypothetical protein